jgi:hypothetical protein
MGSCEHFNEPSNSIKCRNVVSLAERRLKISESALVVGLDSLYLIIIFIL